MLYDDLDREELIRFFHERMDRLEEEKEELAHAFADVVKMMSACLKFRHTRWEEESGSKLLLQRELDELKYSGKRDLPL